MGLEKAEIRAPDLREPLTIEVLLNPTEYTVRHGASWADQALPGLDQPALQFVRGDASTLNLELLIDRSEDRTTILQDLVDLRKLVRIDSEMHSPPVVEFRWGTQGSVFRGVVTSLTERFVLFSEGGDPWRARVTLEMKSWAGLDALFTTANPHSPDRTRTWVVRQGDDLSRIAQWAYGNPALWRPIAEANGIERPRALVVGQVLLVPGQ
jgi:hypothetical protein